MLDFDNAPLNQIGNYVVGGVFKIRARAIETK